MGSQLRTIRIDNKNALTILTLLFKQFPFHSFTNRVFYAFVFFGSGIAFDRSVCSQERTIVPPGTRPALSTEMTDNFNILKQMFVAAPYQAPPDFTLGVNVF